MDLKDQLFQLVRKDKGDKPLFGRKAQVKTFFRDRDAEDSLAYTEHAPVQFSEPKKEKYEGFAIQKFTDKKNGIVFDRHPSLRTSHIKIQSPILCELLEPILRPYELDFDDGYVNIIAPFEPLFFARHDIYRKFLQYEEGTTEREHLGLLINDILQKDLWQLIKETEDLENGNKTTWYLLWTLFPRGSIVIAKEQDGYEQAYQILDSEYKEEANSPLFYDIKCQYIHFNGLQVGFQERYRTIPYFTGKKCITDLDVYPLRLAKRSEYFRETLLERGKKVLDYQDVHHVQIKPAIVDKARPNYDELMKDLGRGDVHGRAIVDFYTAAKRNPRWNHAVKPLGVPAARDADLDGKGKGKAIDLKEQPRNLTTEVDGSIIRPDKVLQQANKKLVMQDETNLVLMYPLLHAFSLESRKWITVNVEAVGPVSFADVAYEHLVADQRQKSLLLSLVESQKLLSDIPEDPIPGKGKGLLVLLSGPPGTGKTLMAEAIAEKARRPLYYVDARDLGAHFTQIADNFKIIMANACEWNAIVLLDEADIYLQQRSLEAPDGNERVTAFLRQLEYFQGILFMTTNLYETLDKAVESRIHIHIPFQSLPYDYRAQIWTHFLDPVQQKNKEVSQADINRLALWSINGRHIKNAFRMSLAYCRQEKKALTLQILDDMVRLTCPHARKESSNALEPVEIQTSAGMNTSLPIVPKGSGSSLPDSPRPQGSPSSRAVQHETLSNVSPAPSNTWQSSTVGAQELSQLISVQAETLPSLCPDDVNSWQLDPSYSQEPQSLPQTPKKTPPPVKKKPSSLR